MSVETTLSTGDESGMFVRGYELRELMAKASFAECVFLMLAGEQPTASQSRMIEAILVSSIDHGINAPSTHVARASASCGVPLATAVAAGIASIGTNHAGAGESCARLFQEALASADAELNAQAANARETGGVLTAKRGDVSPQTASASAAPLEVETLERIAASVVEQAVAAGRNLPGYGHRLYKDEDPRAATLLELAREIGVSGSHTALARTVEKQLEIRKGKKLPLNVDGAQAAVLSDMGIAWRKVQAFFIVARSLGLCAQVLEEQETGRPLAYVKSAPASESYRGPDARSWGGGAGGPGASAVAGAKTAAVSVSMPGVESVAPAGKREGR